MTNLFEPWRIAQMEIEMACGLLIDPSPPNLDRCAMSLACAAGRLAEGRPPEPHATKLRAVVRRAGHLLETAAQYRQGWQKILKGMAADGYTVKGDPAAGGGPMKVIIDG